MGFWGFRVLGFSGFRVLGFSGDRHRAVGAAGRAGVHGTLGLAGGAIRYQDELDTLGVLAYMENLHQELAKLSQKYIRGGDTRGGAGGGTEISGDEDHSPAVLDWEYVQ